MAFLNKMGYSIAMIWILGLGVVGAVALVVWQFKVEGDRLCAWATQVCDAGWELQWPLFHPVISGTIEGQRIFLLNRGPGESGSCGYCFLEARMRINTFVGPDTLLSSSPIPFSLIQRLHGIKEFLALEVWAPASISKMLLHPACLLKKSGVCLMKKSFVESWNIEDFKRDFAVLLKVADALK